MTTTPESSPTYLHLPALLTTTELSIIDGLIMQGNFVDGKETATNTAKSVKENLQMPLDGSPQKEQIQQVVMGAISRSITLQAAVMPKYILPPLISKYEAGMKYGLHVDNPFMGHQFTIRTDVGITIFLSDPSTYTGGELLVRSPAGLLNYKLMRGDAICYPTTQLHEVTPVTEGTRLAAVTWMQCAVRDAHKRELLYQLKTSQQSLESQAPQCAEDTNTLQQVHSNLIRMWAEL